MATERSWTRPPGRCRTGSWTDVDAGPVPRVGPATPGLPGALGRLGVMSGATVNDPIAELIACRDCGQDCLLQVADLCADCIARIGTAADDADYRAWRTENERRVVTGELTGAI
ncbi:hypothetical protein DMP15_20430 [Pseudonocardia sp. UM4_GMWB1]|nr:hypothetical protein BG618_00369 [Pseudonocardia autotrophica]